MIVSIIAFVTWRRYGTYRRLSGMRTGDCAKEMGVLCILRMISRLLKASGIFRRNSTIQGAQFHVIVDA
jgi:hypothetical protein